MIARRTYQNIRKLFIDNINNNQQEPNTEKKKCYCNVPFVDMVRLFFSGLVWGIVVHFCRPCFCNML